VKNRGTGEFVDNIHWWFWNGQNYPGLLSREVFSELMAECLTSGERTLLVSTLMFSATPTKRADEVQKLLERVSSHLGKKSDLGNKIENHFEDQAFDALKAYINVLEYWGLEYSWCDVVDHNNRPALLIQYQSLPKVTLLKSEAKVLQGRPFRFQIIMRGGSLSFDEEV
jgi:hypothetical protein